MLAVAGPERSLSRQDDMNEYLKPVSLAQFACPPGVAGPDDFWGRALFA